MRIETYLHVAGRRLTFSTTGLRRSNFEFWTSPNSKIGWRYGYAVLWIFYWEWDFRNPKNARGYCNAE